MRWKVEVRNLFLFKLRIELPQPVPDWRDRHSWFQVQEGVYARSLITPQLTLPALFVNEGGKTGNLFTSPHHRFERVTSEFNSHLAVHYDQILSSDTNFHAIIHAQPMHLTYLSHIPRYQDELYLNQHLLRWQPETLINLPEGIGFIPFRIPGSAELMKGNVEKLRTHRIVIWAKHGVMARSDISVKRAADRVEYAETAAKYEYFNLSAGGLGEGLSIDELHMICQTFNVQQNIF
ncbi:MAG: class II aldolase/adducin family protein [Anaerolineales bacterium]